MKLIQIAITFALFIFLANATARICTKRWEGNTKKLATTATILAIICAAGSVFLHGLGMHNIQTMLLFCVFLYASYGDFKTHEADDFIHVIILATALITQRAENMPEALLTVLLTGGIMYLVAVLIPGAGIGGADIRFVAACAFLCPMLSCFWGLGLGTFAALLCNSPFRKNKDGEEKAPQPYPMLPYLSCSYMFVYLLSC